MRTRARGQTGFRACHPSTVIARLVAGLLAWTAIAAPATAWDASGHKIIAQIAWDRLSPNARTEARTLVRSLGVDFVEAGVWLDQVRGGGVRLFDRWHYINQPSEDSTGSAPRAHADNVLWAIAASRDGVAAGEAPTVARALALVTLIHVVGDVHQPLHVVSRYDAAHPRGDRGGNRFELPAPWHNLHRLWDRMGGLVQPPDASRSSLDAKAIRRWAMKLAKRHPPGDHDHDHDHDLDPDTWADESRRLANRSAYPGIESGRAPTDDYLERVRTVAARRLVEAGARLAALIEDALGEARRPQR